ncbi:MAG: hypothetical protein ACLFTR_03810 [Candidatus Woesearchaeota archaeon]
MSLIRSRKGLLDNVGEWFFPALIALAIGFGVAYLMSKGTIPDLLNLF